MMTRPGGRSNRSVAPADSAGVACGAADPRGPTRGSRGSRRIRRERCSEGASCCDADGCSRRLCAAATFSARSRAPRSTRSTACAGWRSRECVDSTNLALERHLNARHGPRETSNRAWAGVGAVLVHGLLARPPINSRSFCRSWLRSRPVPAGLCLGAAGQRPETARLRGALGGPVIAAPALHNERHT